MKTYKILPILVLILVSGPLVVRAQEQPVPIWPGLAPGSENKEDKELWTEKKDVSQVYQPDLTIFLPEQAQGPFPAIVVCPGGGYRKLVMEYHPDRIVSKGLPEEFTKFAQDKFREIQEAFDMIRKERRMT